MNGLRKRSEVVNRNNKCKYCTTKKRSKKISQELFWDDLYDIEICNSIYLKGSNLIFDSSNKFYYDDNEIVQKRIAHGAFKIAYCPICGRKLE